MMSKIELLPNEILYKCFKYLNGIDIFYSFDQLNYRFNQLIRSIPLYIDFQNIQKLLFNHFCKKILPNKEIQKQIYSLSLSDRNIYNQIQPFLSLFSFDEFPQLQSLSLAEVTSYDVSQLKLMLPLICQLRSFRLLDTYDQDDELLSVLPTFQLRTLEIPSLSTNLKLINQFSLIKNLTIAACSTYELCQLLSTITSLKYLKVDNVSEHELECYYYVEHDPYKNLPKDPCIHLKHLIMLQFQGQFHELEEILKRTPNLINLTIHINNNKNMDKINANQLEHLITSLLPNLKIFKFIIQCSYNYSIEEKFKEFQNDFWCKEHNWYTEYLVFKSYALIYTIPYMFHTYKLIPYTKIYRNNLVNNSKTFQNVTDLTIDPDALIKDCQYYFSHITSMILGSEWYWSNKPILTKTHTENLKMIINLSNLKQLNISRYQLETSTVLLELLKQASQLSSLIIHSNVLRTLFDNDELCNYLNKMIVRLNIMDERGDAMDDSIDLNKFCKTFSNLERLICQLDQCNAFLFLLKHLSKLTYINVFFV